MITSTPPTIQCGQVIPLLPVTNVSEAVAYYISRLGFREGFIMGDPPDFAGVNLGDVSVHLSGRTQVTSPVYIYFVVDDADALYRFHQENGVEIVETPTDRHYGLRDYQVRDLYGNELGFGHYIYHVGGTIPIERVEVPVRLEKRLAALLADLAEHKGMSIGSCLEETLLHTFEKVRDGVASPHTEKTHQYIQELKKKHGIDYDTHASYRFVE